jgi:hypothetical protein
MRTLTVVFASAAAALSLSLSSAMAQTLGPPTGGPVPSHLSNVEPIPSHPSTTGQAARSPEVIRRGANQSFASCPPNQRKKGGKGSAPRC